MLKQTKQGGMIYGAMSVPSFKGHHNLHFIPNDIGSFVVLLLPTIEIDPVNFMISLELSRVVPTMPGIPLHLLQGAAGRGAVARPGARVHIGVPERSRFPDKSKALS